MNARRMITTAVTMAALLAGPLTVEAQGAGSAGGAEAIRRGPPEARSIGRLLGWLWVYLELDFTDAQLERLETILDQRLPAINALSDEMRWARRNFLAGVQPGEIEADEIRRFAVSQAPVYVEFVVATAYLKADMMEILSQSQRERLGAVLDLVEP